MKNREQQLLPHYNEHLSYRSSLDGLKFQTILEILQTRICPRERVLDLGCGDARLYESLKPYHVDYTGVDYSEGRINRARNTYPEIALVYGDVRAFLSDSGSTFGAITCFEVLEHLEDPEEVVSLALSRLTPDGILIGSVPINMPYVAHLQVFKTVEDVQERLKPTLCTAEHGHFWCKWELAHI